MADESRWCRRVFAAFEHSVVRLHFQRRFVGTGFVVHWSGAGRKCLIMSCAHVCRSIPAGQTMDVFFSGSTRASQATVLHIGNVSTDLALLRVTRMDPRVRARGSVVMHFFDPPVTAGWSVVLLGYNNLRRRSILTPSTWLGRITSEPHAMHISYTCTATGGLSGSPVVLAGVHRVVGVHVRRHGATRFGIGVRTIRSFLRRITHADNQSIEQMLSIIAGPGT